MREPAKSSPNTRVPQMNQVPTPTPSTYQPDKPGTPEEAPTQQQEGEDTTLVEEELIPEKGVHHKVLYQC